MREPSDIRAWLITARVQKSAERARRTSAKGRSPLRARQSKRLFRSSSVALSALSVLSKLAGFPAQHRSRTCTLASRTQFGLPKSSLDASHNSHSALETGNTGKPWKCPEQSDGE